MDWKHVQFLIEPLNSSNEQYSIDETADHIDYKLKIRNLPDETKWIDSVLKTASFSYPNQKFTINFFF